MVIWTNRAVSHIEEFIKNAREDTENTARKYMTKLIDYVDTLQDLNKIGKPYNVSFTKYELRQLVYKSHKIYYTIEKDNVIILAVLHSKLNINNALKKILDK